MVDKRQIAGKDVYIFESHSTAIVPWGQIRRKRSNAPILITLDYHSDTREAFSHLSKIDAYDEASLYEAAKILKNDEQIDAAIRADIISFAFIISYDDQGTQSREEKQYYEDNYGAANCMRIIWEETKSPYPTRPYTYDMPESKMFVVDDSEGFECDKDSRDTHEKQHFDLAIESPYLDKKLQIINEMSSSVGITNVLAHDYILDIDLDYFKTRNSIEPRDKKTFYNLIKSAQAITIAMEPYFVKEEKYPGEKIDPDFLLNTLLEHIYSARVT